MERSTKVELARPHILVRSTDKNDLEVNAKMCGQVAN